MANINVTVRMDEDLKCEAEALFDNLGMSLTTAINVFVRQAVREGRIPFEVGTAPSCRSLPVTVPGYYRAWNEPRVEYAVVELPKIDTPVEEAGER